MDDIVTFLREDACQYGEWENACTAEGPCPSCMAADEIERLRNIITKQTQTMQDALTSLAGNPPNPPAIIKNAGNPL